jgi:hypothetical protein
VDPRADAAETTIASVDNRGSFERGQTIDGTIVVFGPEVALMPLGSLAEKLRDALKGH